MDVSINNHNQDDFLDSFPIGSFLQSRFWKYFLDLQGIKNWQLNVYDNNHLVAHALIYTNKLPFGKGYLYSPKGPIMVPGLRPEEYKEAFELILSQARDITIATRRREEIFCRLEPTIASPELTGLPMQKATPQQPSTTAYLDLTKPADELFAGFKEKTRYNIRLAQKKGLTIHWSQDESALPRFLKVMSSTKNRNHFRLHEKKHFHYLLKAGKKFDNVFISWAEYNGKTIAANLYIVQPTCVTYLMGGFDYKYRELMAPYLLQWEAIQFAAQRGALVYDFWGVAPDDGSKPSWAGFTRFKDGFNGTLVKSPGCFDFIYNPFLYKVYTNLRSFRRKIRI